MSPRELPERPPRRELGYIARKQDLAVRTVEAGGLFEDAVVEVSLP